MHLADMTAMLAYLTLLGWAATRTGPLWYVFGALGILIALHDGYYWSIFARGHGFFTANRTSALAIFLVCLFGPGLVVQLHWRFIGHRRWRDKVLRQFDDE